jgi:hypothetical protein
MDLVQLQPAFFNQSDDRSSAFRAKVKRQISFFHLLTSPA